MKQVCHKDNFSAKQAKKQQRKGKMDFG